MRLRALLVLALSAPMLLAGTSEAGQLPSKAVPGTVVVALPAGILFGYATTEMVLPQGTTLQLFNPDPLTPHDVRSKVTRKVKTAQGFDNVPIFMSVNAATGSVVPVDGTEKLKPGTYDFYCALHPQKMKGTLTVI